jgi:Ca-activated chloride channel homolog
VIRRLGDSPIPITNPPITQSVNQRIAMFWSSPLALAALLAVPLVVALLVRGAVRRREALAAFGAGGGARGGERGRALLLVGAVGLLALAAAGPRYGTELREIRQEGVDLVIALDVSNSMRAEDVAPSRLERARHELEGVLASLRGSRVGIVLFAGEAFLHCPLTTDLNAVRLFLRAADPSLIPTQGTDLAEALRVAAEAFEAGAGGAADDPRARVVLVVSDGEDHPDRYGPALRAAEDAGIVFYAAGVGEPEGGPIPVYRDGRIVGYETDRTGAEVVTRLAEGTLRRIAQTGAYYPIGRAGGSLDAFPAALARLDRSVLSSEAYAAYAERYQWPLGLALLLLLAERLLAVRRRAPAVAG